MNVLRFPVVLIAIINLAACSGGGDDAPQNPTNLSLSVADASVTEGGSGTTNMVFTISLNQAVMGGVEVQYATSNGSATAGIDYTATSGLATISAGSTSTTVSVPVMGDSANEGNETFTLNLSNPSSGAALARASATGTIIDDDAPAIPNLSVSDANVIEGDSGTTDLTFTLMLSAVSSSNVTVNYETLDGSATQGEDYVAANGTATITAGDTTTSVSVTINGDTDVEPDQTFTLNLSNASGANLVTSSATGTIINDDVATTAGPYRMYNYPNSLYAVNLSDPSQTVYIGAIDIGSDEAEMIFTGDVNVGDLSMTNFRPHTFVYFDESMFWRVDARVGSNLTPVRISSANVGYVCSMDVVDNALSPLDSYIVYLAGTDQNNCQSSGQPYAIRVGDDDTVAPTSLSGILANAGDVTNNIRLIQDSATIGEVTGFLVTQTADGSVTRYDANFSNPATIFEAFPVTQFLADRDGGDLSINATFFHVNGVLHAYTHSMSSTATVVMHTAAQGSSFDDRPDNDFICNPTHCFFTEFDNNDHQTVILAAINGSGSSEITTYTTDNLLWLGLTNGRLYMVTIPKAGGGMSLRAADLTAGPITVTEVEGPLPSEDSFTAMFGVGESFYYSIQDDSANSVSFTVRQDNGNVIGPVADTSLVGSLFTNSQLGTVFLPSSLIVGEEVSTPTAGLKLTLYDAASATAGIELGVIEGATFGGTTYGFMGTFGFGVGSILVGQAMIGLPPNIQTDIFYLDSTTSNSLYRVTNTDTTSEGVL